MRKYWDSTSLRAFQNCPRKYQYRILESWVTKSTKVDLEFGRHYHRALELYDKALVDGVPFDQAVFIAANYALTCGFTSDDKHKNRFTLARSVVWYTEQFKTDFFETLVYDGKAAVELSFSLELPVEYQGQPYILCGHLDRAVRERTGDVYVDERKTTKKSLAENYFRQFSPDIQVSIYTVASRIVLPEAAKGVMIDAAQTLIEGTNFARHLAHRSPAVCDEAIRDICLWIKQAERCFEENYWPKNEASCFLCEFKDVCSRDPSVRELWLKAEYVQSPWNPEESR